MKKLKKLILAALFAALTCVGTMIIRIPTLHGYIHPGDAVVLLSGYLLGPAYGAIAAGIGSGLADLFSGYTVYVPGTVLIKGITALFAGLIYSEKRRTFLFAVIGGVVSELFMVVGYFLYETVIFGEGAFLAAIPGNVVQGIVGLFIALLLLPLLKRAMNSIQL